MKKAQFYLLFAFFFSFFVIFLLSKNIFFYENDDSFIHDYLVNELSYLTAWNCSYNLTTIQNFSKIANLNIEIYEYWDNCGNKILTLKPYKDKLKVKEEGDYYIACLNDSCRKVIKEGKHFCMVYKLVDSIFFDCW